MNTVSRLLAVAGLALLAACSNLFVDHPVGGSMPGTPDTRLVGVWKATTNQQAGEAGYMFVSPKKKGSGFHVVFVGWTANKPVETLEFDVTTGNTGGDAFVNVSNVVEDGKPAGKEIPGYIPYVYSFAKDGTLVIFDHSDAGMKLIRSAVEKHKVRGTVKVKSNRDNEPNMNTDMDIHLTSDQKTLDAFFAANAKAIFTDSVDTFAPVKVP